MTKKQRRVRHKRRVRYILSLVAPEIRQVLKAAKLEPLCTLEAEEMFIEWLKKQATMVTKCDCPPTVH